MTPAEVLTQLAALAHAVEPTLDTRSYYELLNVPGNATASAVRAAYYRLAAQLHPDRYLAMKDEAAKSKLESIYARITEGYRVLSDAEKRARYDQGLPAGKKRWSVADRETRGPKNPEDALKHPEAKKFFRLGVLSLHKQDFRGAVMNFSFAKSYEPGSVLIQDKLAEAQQGLAHTTQK